MGKIIKVKCNGSGKHVNEVDVQKILKKDVVLKGRFLGRNKPDQSSIPERIVLKCKKCPNGKVIITRKMIEATL